MKQDFSEIKVNALAKDILSVEGGLVVPQANFRKGGVMGGCAGLLVKSGSVGAQTFRDISIRKQVRPCTCIPTKENCVNMSKITYLLNVITLECSRENNYEIVAGAVRRALEAATVAEIETVNVPLLGTEHDSFLTEEQSVRAILLGILLFCNVKGVVKNVNIIGNSRNVNDIAAVIAHADEIVTIAPEVGKRAPQKCYPMGFDGD